jgi:hypothetical protein
MQKGDVVLNVFVPTDQNASKAIHPTMSSFYDPPASLEASFTFDRLSFLSPRTNVSSETKLLQQLADFVKVITFVQAHALRLLKGWLRTLDRTALDCLAHHLHIIPVGPVYGQADRDAVGFRQQTAFDARFASVGWIFAGFFPRPMGPSLLRHPCLTNSSRCLSVHRTFLVQLARGPRIPRIRPILETGGAPLNPNRSPSGRGLSTDSLSGVHRKLHWHISGQAREGGRRRSDVY